MFEETKDPRELFSEIEARGAGWRAEHLELPVSLLFLSRIKRALAGMGADWDGGRAWAELKARGESLARRRALFVAAEAAGHRFGRGEQIAEHERIRAALGVVVEEGTSLHKVRALRAMTFIPSDECVPILEKALQDQSPWVQATALQTFFNLDLRQRAPRKVLKDFLLETYRRQTGREPLAILRPETVVKNFRLNKGLLLGLLKVPGGKRLALLSLLLWIAASLVTVLTAVGVALIAVAYAAGVAAHAVFVRLPRKILSTPDLARKTGRALFWVGKALFFVAVLLPLAVITLPFWARGVKPARQSFRERYLYLALLDYPFAYLLYEVAPLFGTKKTAIVASAFAASLLASMLPDDRRAAEKFRWFCRCACTGALAWFAYSSGQSERLTLTLVALTAAQAVWLLPLLARILWLVITGLARDTVLWFRWSIEHREKATAPIAEAEAHAEAGEGPPRELSWGEALSLVGRALSLLVKALSSFVKGLPDRLRNVARNLRVSLRENLRRLLGWALFVLLLLAVAYYLLGGANVWAEGGPRVIGPELGARLVSLKPGLYFALGTLLAAIPCAVLLLVFHLVWDELLIVERVRFRVMSRSPERFRNVNDFLGYVFQIVRDETRPTRLRARAAFALTQVPLASRDYVEGLTDLAEEDLPINVSDAVYQAVEDAENRRKRGQSDNFEIDMGLINRQLEDLWQPGEVLRPWLFKGLAALLLFPLLAGALLYYFGPDGPADTASLACLALGSALVLLYALLARREGRAGKWSLMFGLALIASVFVRPLQVPLRDAGWDGVFANGAVGLVDLADFSALVIPATLAAAFARVGHTVYLLGSDAKIDLSLEGKPGFMQRKFSRLNKQARIIRPLLLCALAAALAQSRPLQSYLERRGERLPAFAAGGKASEVELRGVPTDGRVVRVAMLRADDPDAPESQDEEARRRSEVSDAVLSSLRDGGVIPLDAEAVWGDVWLTFEGGRFRGWWTSPVKCLEPSGAAADTVTFDTGSLCSFNFGTAVRMVAVVYDERRSAFIKGMPVRPFEEATGTLRDMTHPPDALLLVDTASPFVKSSWSPPFSP